MGILGESIHRSSCLLFQSELFQDDLYPDTAGDIPACTADEFMEGTKDSNPVMVNTLVYKK